MKLNLKYSLTTTGKASVETELIEVSGNETQEEINAMVDKAFTMACEKLQKRSLDLYLRLNSTIR